jgi:hypothetical protein
MACASWVVKSALVLRQLSRCVSWVCGTRRPQRGRRCRLPWIEEFIGKAEKKLEMLQQNCR